MKKRLHQLCRLLGFDFYRYPSPSSFEMRLARLMKETSIDLVIDVGANKGQFGTSIRRFGYDGYLLSFEPVRQSFDSLCAISKEDTKWESFPYALGSVEGEIVINVMEGSNFNSLYTPSIHGSSLFDEEIVTGKEKVLIRRLDSFLAKAGVSLEGRRVLLKTDTQGHDLEVFRGAQGIWPQVSLLLMELSVRPIYEGTSGWQEVIRIVGENGFTLWDLFPVNHGTSGAIVEYDGVFIREDLHT